MRSSHCGGGGFGLVKVLFLKALGWDMRLALFLAFPIRCLDKNKYVIMCVNSPRINRKTPNNEASCAAIDSKEMALLPFPFIELISGYRAKQTYVIIVSAILKCC